jgi:hypothetical protein
MANIKGKPFTDILGEAENGQLLQDLTEAYYNVTAAVMETRKVGKIKLALTFTPTGKGTVNVDASYDAVEPEHDRPTTTFFVGKDYSLQRHDPAQPRLPLREVEIPSNDPVKVTL